MTGGVLFGVFALIVVLVFSLCMFCLLMALHGCCIMDSSAESRTHIYFAEAAVFARSQSRKSLFVLRLYAFSAMAYFHCFLMGKSKYVTTHIHPHTRTQTSAMPPSWCYFCWHVDTSAFRSITSRCGRRSLKHHAPLTARST